MTRQKEEEGLDLIILLVQGSSLTRQKEECLIILLVHGSSLTRQKEEEGLDLIILLV